MLYGRETEVAVSARRLDHAADACRHDFHILRLTGVECEFELAFAALHMVLAPALDAPWASSPARS